MLATTFFAHGTPMLLAGDEFGRSQRGNNNAYCQDKRAVLARLEASGFARRAGARNADELRPCTEKSTRAVAVERLDMNSPVPPGTNDLSQSLRIVLIRPVDLHLEGSACVPGIETNDFEPEIAEFVHEPWRHPTKQVIDEPPMV